MAYQSLYRRYRPQRFAEVRGQAHLVRALRNAVVDGRVGHAYLFSGPRGTGKTSTARILAKVLNCDLPIEGEPCGACLSCKAIEAGTSFDVHELDAASNNGVEAIRDLINKAALGTPGRTKVYILDEVHMLTQGASNALLKTLEEPPEHVVFVLATTDPQKVLPTIKSRTQHFEVHLLPRTDLEELVDFIITDAALEVSPDAREYVLRAGGGSARDTLSALDQVVAAGAAPIDDGAIDELVEALCDRDTKRALVAVDDAMNSGRTPRVVGEELMARLRDVFLAALRADLSRLSERERERVNDQAARLGPAGATRALEVLGDVFVGIKDAPDPRVHLEASLVRLTCAEADHSLAAIVERLERLERGLGPIGAPPPSPHVAESAPATAESPAKAAPATAEATADVPATDVSPASGRTRPADEARRTLAKSRAQTPAAPVRAVPSAARASTAKGPAKAAVPDAATDAAPKATRSRSATAVSSPDAAFPTRDDLTLAWADDVLPTLPQKVRSRASSGRFVDVVDGVAVYSLPNAQVLGRFDEVRSQVEEALTARFGVPVPMRLVVAASDAAPADVGAPDEPGDAALDEDIDVGDLVDAQDAPHSSVDRIVELFPGAEIVDEAH